MVRVAKVDYKVSWYGQIHTWLIVAPDNTFHTYAANPTSYLPSHWPAGILITSREDTRYEAKTALPDYLVMNEDFAKELRFIHYCLVRHREWNTFAPAARKRKSLGGALLQKVQPRSGPDLRPADIVIEDDGQALDRTTFWYAFSEKRERLEVWRQFWEDTGLMTRSMGFPVLHCAHRLTNVRLEIEATTWMVARHLLIELRASTMLTAVVNIPHPCTASIQMPRKY